MNKMWKRSLSLFLAMVMIVGMVPMNVFATELECAHENVEYIDEPATCVWEGYYAEYCNDCQQYLVEELLPAAGHEWADGVCAVCGEAEAVEPEAEEPVETPDAEITEEETAEELVEIPAVYDMVPDGALTGIIWLDKTRDEDLYAKVMAFELGEMVLTAVNWHNTTDKVYYNALNGSKYDVANFMDLASMYEELKDVLTGQATLHFTIGSGASAKEAYVTFRNIAHLRFDITMPAVESKGAPADLDARVQSAVDAATITVTHGGDVIDWTAISDALIDVQYNAPGGYTWPELGKSAECAAEVTIAIYDSVDQTTAMTGSAKVELVDTTPTYTVTFKSGDNVLKTYKVLENHDLPEEALDFEPVRQYYNFKGWNTEVVATVTGDATYVAQWEVDPRYDTANNNGIADYEELFEVKYLLTEDAAEAYASKHQRYGAATFIPGAPECPHGEEECSCEANQWNFLGWAPLGSEEGTVAKTVTNHATYVAKWAERTKIVVSYTKYITGGETETFECTAVYDENGKNPKAIEFTYTGANQVWDGWYYTDSEGNNVKWDFNTVIPLSEGETLYLFGTLGFDMDGFNGVDGTKDDPIVDFIFQYPVEEVNDEGDLVTNWYSYHEDITWHVKDGEEAKPDFSAITIPDTRDDDRIYTGSELRVEDAADANAKKHYMQPSFVDDRNNNVKDDAEETAQITVNDTALGTFSIDNHTVAADGTFLANTNGDTNGKNGYATKIVVTPAKGANSYVSKLLVNNVEQELNLEDDGSAWILLHEAKLPAVAARSIVKYNIQVVFATKAIEYKTNAEIEASGKLIPGKTYTDADVNDVYDAIVASPAREGAEVEVKYVARAKETVTVNVSALKDDIIARYGTLANTIIGKVWPGDTVEVELSELVKPISYQPEGPVLTPQQVVDSYILDLQGAELNDLLVAVGAMKITVPAKVRESANIHPFMYTGTETVVANYKGTPEINGDEHKITVTDNRAVPTINVKEESLTVTVGKYSDNTLLNNVTLSGVTGKLVNSFENVNARTYEGVPVYFAGNETTKPAVGTFDLTIEKAQAALSVKSVIVEKHDDIYNAAPVVKPSDVGVISVVAGLDLNELDLDLSKVNPQVNLKNIKAKAWISLTDDLKEVMDLLGVDTSSSKSRTLEEIETILRKNQSLLKSMNLSENAINAILKTLEKVNQYSDAELEIFFSDDVYPTNPGVYLNLAVVSDPRYDANPALGTIMVAPAVLLPDRGAQLTYDGEAKHMFAEPATGNPIALDVAPAGAKVYYYGLNAELRVWSTTDAPALPGVYLASTVFTDANGKLCSDAALLVIGMTDVALDVETGYVEVDGEFHSPKVTVTDKEGKTVTDAAVTMISGTVTVDNDKELGLEDLGASVNISFPDAVHTAWAKFFKTLNDQDKVNLPHINEDLSKAKINPATLIKFLNYCKGKLNGAKDEIPFDKLAEHLPDKYINKTEEYYNKTLDKLIAAANKLNNAAKKLPDGIMEITFEQNKQYKETGVYLHYGIVTDPKYLPASNAGILVIKEKDDALVLLDTHSPYNAQGQKPYGWDNTNRDGITLVVDKKAGTMNFIMDDHMTKVIEKFNAEVYDLTGKNINDLYNGAENKAEKLVTYICNGLKEKAVEKIKAKLPENTAQDEIDKLIAKVDTDLAKVRAKLEKDLSDLKDLAAKKGLDGDFIFNGDLPVNVGTYDFYSYSYAIEVARAKLYIEPIYVRVAAGDVTRVYNGKSGIEDLEPTISYYSFKSIEGEELKEVKVTLPAGVTETSLGLTYDVVCTGKNVGTHTIDICNAKINETPNFHNVVNTVDGTLTITPMVLKVAIADAEKYFGNADPDFKPEIKEGTIYNDEVKVIVKRATGENVGTYELEAALEPGDTKNYTVELVNDKTPVLTIKEAEIKIIIAEDYTKQFDAAEDPAYTYTYEIVNGLETYTDEQKKAFVEALGINIVRGEQLEGSVDGKDNVGDVFALTAEVKNPNANVKVAEIDTGKLTIDLGDYICWIVGGKPYNDVTDALKIAAANGETVQMLKDATAAINGKDEETIIVYAGTTLDLNGFYVETDNLLSFGVVMDSMETTVNPLGGVLPLSTIADDGLKSGGILISNDTAEAWTQLQTANGGIIPVYDTDTGSYKFFQGHVMALGYKNGTATSVKFGCRILMDNAEGYYILGRSEDASLDVIGEMHWTGITVFDIEYKFKGDTVRDYGTQAYNQCNKDNDGTKTTKSIVLTVRGLDNLGSDAEISFKPIVQTASTFADTAADTNTYDIP